jgi:hypothetical protein
MADTLRERIGWKLWGVAVRLPGVCPSNAHTVFVCTHRDRSRNPMVDRTCRRDCAYNGSCYCNKLRRDDGRVAP